ENRGQVLWDSVNPGNEQQLSLELSVARFGPLRLDESVLELRNYILATPHEDVTRLPGAARDFSFVCADMQRVAGWSAEDQEGLLAFVLSGGHLCLYNTSAYPTWQNITLDKGAANAGRGLLLPVAGGFDAAREAMAGWLTGELTELVLLYGGAAGKAA